MALSRPAFESSVLVREEVAPLLASRAQAHMILKNWAEGAADCKGSWFCYSSAQQGQGQVQGGLTAAAAAAWNKLDIRGNCIRRGKCLVEMGMWDKAKKWAEEVDGEVFSKEQAVGGGGGGGVVANYREWEDLKREVGEGYAKSRQ